MPVLPVLLVFRTALREAAEEKKKKNITELASNQSSTNEIPQTTDKYIEFVLIRHIFFFSSILSVYSLSVLRQIVFQAVWCALVCVCVNARESREYASTLDMYV